MKMAISLILVGVLILFCAGVPMLTGYASGTSRGETVPKSVRDNPASYRPSYSGYSGYRVPVSSGSGGYSSGK